MRSEYDKGYEGKGVSYLDPAKSKQDNLSEVIETLYLDKDGERTLYTQGTPKNKEVIVPDGLQKIMDDIDATEVLKYMKGIPDCGYRLKFLLKISVKEWF